VGVHWSAKESSGLVITRGGRLHPNGGGPPRYVWRGEKKRPPGGGRASGER